MHGKNDGRRPRELSISSELMGGLFSDDPLMMQGLAMMGTSGGNNGGLLLSHTPPNFTPGSYEVSHMKRARAGSISGRLRSASDLEEKGLIDKSQKGVLKDLIISGDSELHVALDLYDRGDSSELEALMEAGLLDRRDSFDLLQDLDFGSMDLGTANADDFTDALGRVETGGDDDEGGVAKGGGGVGATAGGGGGSDVGDISVRSIGMDNLNRRIKEPAIEDREISGSGSGDDSDIKIDLVEGGADFDIGEMAFDTTFEHNYATEDVDMKEGGEPIPSAAAAAHGTLSELVGPLKVSTAERRSNLTTHLTPSEDEESESRPVIGADEEGGGDGNGVDPGGHHHGEHPAGPDGFGTSLDSAPGAALGEFSPQFQFSFTDDIHLDLGGGLKDELRDLDSLSEPLPGQLSGKGVGLSPPILGTSAGHSSRVQLLSRGGPSTIKTEIVTTVTEAPRQLGSTRSGTAAAIAGAAASLAASTKTGSDAAGYNANVHASMTSTGRHPEAYGGGRNDTSVGLRGALMGAGSGHPEAGYQNASVASPQQATRGRPVVSDMGIMVGSRSAVPAGGEERKYVGAYSPEARRQRIQRFKEKREHRVWTKMVKYDVRKNFADTRMRVKGRFVKKEDEALLREVMACA